MIDENFIIHLVEARRRLIYIILCFGMVFLLLFHFSNQIYTIFSAPLLTYLPNGTRLIATDITSPFFVPLKLTLIVAFIISLPHTIYQLWQFIAPALYIEEKKLLLIMAPSIMFLFVIGMLFCYYVVLPLIFNFISHIKAGEITMMTDISKYLDFILNLFFVFGISFQMPVVIFLLIYFNLISLAKMQSIRCYMLIGVFIIGAILAPPDILSQTLLALPLYLLYELGMIIARIFGINFVGGRHE